MTQRIISLALCLILLCTLAPAASAAFSDTGGHYAQAAIDEAREKGWLNGYPDGSFRPDAIITRAEFAKMMLSATQLRPDSETGAFFRDQRWAEESNPLISDVKNHWIKTQGWLDLAWNSGLLMATDYGEGKLYPDGPIRRYEMAVLATRALGLVSPAMQHGEALPAFADGPRLAPWVRGYIIEATKAGILKGYEDGTFGGDRTATRGEAVTIVSRVAAAMALGGQRGADTEEVKSLVLIAPDQARVRRAYDMPHFLVRDGYVYLDMAEAVGTVFHAEFPDSDKVFYWDNKTQSLSFEYSIQYLTFTPGTVNEEGLTGRLQAPVANLLWNWRLMVPIYQIDTGQSFWNWGSTWDSASRTLTVEGNLPGANGS